MLKSAGASRALVLLRAVLRNHDFAAERIWERWRFASSRPPSNGEMTAILRRNGIAGFSEYVLGQRLGHYGARCFVAVDRQAVLDALRRHYPQEGARAIEIAERALGGVFDVLGSGPVDCRRGRRGGGHRLDWTLDPTTGNRYPRIFSQWRWNPYRLRRGNADMKGPWELTRCQHFAALGQAYWLTGDERYASLYANTITDFLRRNPPGFGIQWGCTMDVALRMVGWLSALPFFQGSRALGLRWWRRFLKGLVEHGRFIAANLEFGTIDNRVATSNHYLANLLGLYWIARCFPGLDAGTVWRGLAEAGLEREMQLQIKPDGADFESSIPYQRLTIEFLLSAYALSLHGGVPLSEPYRDRLVSALRFIKALRQPGGRLPQIGDADSGRAHILTGYGAWDQERMDHLLAAGARVLNCPALSEGLPAEALVEQVFWDTPRGVPTAIVPIAGTELFPDAGIALLRRDEHWLALTNGLVGTAGFGNHKHNDQLAVEWAIGAQPLLVDGGSYTYSQDGVMRNLFRSVLTHNTVSIDGEEQNVINPEYLFRMYQTGHASLAAATVDAVCGAWGYHTAYERLADPARHTRRVVLLPDGAIVIDDLVETAGEHRLRWFFLAHPSVEALVGHETVILRGPRGAGRLTAPGLEWQRVESWYSPEYGKKLPCAGLVAERRAGGLNQRIFLLPADWQGELQAASEAATAFWNRAMDMRPEH